MELLRIQKTMKIEAMNPFDVLNKYSSLFLTSSCSSRNDYVCRKRAAYFYNEYERTPGYVDDVDVWIE